VVRPELFNKWDMGSPDKHFDRLRHDERAGYLIAGFITKTLSVEEHQELDAWVLATEENMQLFEDLTDEPSIELFLLWMSTLDVESNLVNARLKLAGRKGKIVRLRWYKVAAACAILFLALWWFWPAKPLHADPVVSMEHRPNSGRQVVTMTLPSGLKVNLDARDTSFAGIVVKDGVISHAIPSADSGWHEIVIPRNASFRVILPDGTKVWLNNQSSIRYPARFEGKVREVSVTGETFFQVAKDPAKPFIAAIGQSKIVATGTSFDVNGFEDAVTLIEGAIQVISESGKRTVFPGEQICLGDGSVTRPDLAAIVAWTQNKFRFRNQDIYKIMDQISRWYDVKINFADSINYHFNGTVDRTVPVTRILELLEGTGQVHFTVTDRTITIKK
jgi:ferric-dicitrate binding protein FerR (iron transport regulator)